MTAPNDPGSKPVLGQLFQRDLHAAAGRLEAWFQDRIHAQAVKLDSLSPTREPGLSHELLCVDVSWLAEGRRISQGFILRLDPVHYRKRHTSNLRREFDVQSILHARGDPPVAQVHWFENSPDILGAQFYAMERLEGRVLPETPPWQLAGWVVDLSPADRGTLWRNAVSTMAKIHRVPMSALTTLRREGAAERDFERQLHHWRASYEWATAGRGSPRIEAGWRWLFGHKPANPPEGLAWGDAHPRNMMFHGLICHAVLDWEDVALGSPLSDLGRWLLTDRLQAIWGRPTPSGIPSPEEFVTQWESETGYSAADLRWFQVLNCCFAAGTLARSRQLQKEMLGEVIGTDAKGADAVEQVLAELLEGALNSRSL